MAREVTGTRTDAHRADEPAVRYHPRGTRGIGSDAPCPEEYDDPYTPGLHPVRASSCVTLAGGVVRARRCRDAIAAMTPRVAPIAP